MPYCHVNDIRMYYEIRGRGEPLVFIHGLGSSSRDWEAQIPVFKKGYRVVALDLRGHGRSSKPPGPYQLPQFAQDTAGLLQALGLESVHVVGISMGGMVAFELAVKYPNLLSSITVVNSYPEMRVETLRERWNALRRFTLLEVFGVRGMGIALARHLFPKPNQATLRHTFIERWAENDKRAYRESLKAILDWDVEDRLPEIQCPVLVVASDQDYMPVDEKQAYADLIPNARLAVIEDARHAVTAEKPQTFNKVLKEFLTELERNP